MVMEYMQYISISLGLAFILIATILYLNEKVSDLQHIMGWWDVDKDLMFQCV